MPQDHSHQAVTDDYSYDVFVSYSSADQAWVRGELLDRLEVVAMLDREGRP